MMLAFVSVTLSLSHSQTHLPFVLHVTPKRGRWSTLIKRSRALPLSDTEERKETFHFHLCFFFFFL